MRLYFTSPETFRSNFQKKALSKNVNLDEKKSPHNEKKSKNVNLGDKKSQTNVKRHENVNLSKKGYNIV